MSTTVTFLGVGAALPAPGQTNCSYLVEGGGMCLLFDCGPAVLQQLAAVGKTPGDVTHVFVSHGHGDHALGWPMLLLWWSLEGQKGRPPPVVLAGQTTWGHLRKLWRHSYSEIPEPVYGAVELADGGGENQLAPAAAMATQPMVHSTAFPVLGARLTIGGQVLAFTADTARCDSIGRIAKGADLLVHDARHAVSVAPALPDQAQYHCTARDAGESAQAAGAKSLALVHIGAEYDGRQAELVAEAQAVFYGRVFVPAAGEVIRV